MTTTRDQLHAVRARIDVCNQMLAESERHLEVTGDRAWQQIVDSLEHEIACWTDVLSTLQQLNVH